MRGQPVVEGGHRTRGLAISDHIKSSFLTYRNGRYLKLAAGVAILSIAAYVFYYVTQPTVAPNGGTTLGLVYGGAVTGAILLLMGYSLRKRSHRSRLGMLQGWLSSHFYIGLLTLLLVPLHAGFEFGVNIHTLAHALLVVVVLSGLLGAYLFFVKPRQFAQYGTEIVYPGDVVDRDNIDNQLNKTCRQMETLSRDKSEHFRTICAAEIRQGQPRRGLGWRLLLRNHDETVGNPLDELQQYLPQIPDHEQADFNRLSALVKRKREVEYQLATQMRLKNLMQVWLYIHLPVSVVMLTAVIIHVALVLYY